MELDVPRDDRPAGQAAVLLADRSAHPQLRRAPAAQLVGFLVLSVLGAVLAVATPLLAGQVVNAIVGARSRSPWCCSWRSLIAVIAIAEAGLGLWLRWLSARIGEGLILDLRRAVFDHVLNMPIAFFTRTRTGALVSRLNNDVVGAQRAFSETLSGVVSNSSRSCWPWPRCSSSPGRSPCWPCCCFRCSSFPPGGWAGAWPGCSWRAPTTTR